MTQKFTIAQIPYLNCAPFYWDKNLRFPGHEIEWKWAAPSDLGILAREGLIDAGPVSLLNGPGLASDFDLLPYGIEME